MPIKKMEFWVVECYYCREILAVSDEVGFSVFHSENDAKSAFGDDSEWGIDEESPHDIICPECRDIRMKREDSSYEIDGLY